MQHIALRWHYALSIYLAVICSIFAHGQVITVDDTTAPPTQGVGHDFIKLFNETVNPANGSLSLRIELPVPEARGIDFPVAETYNSSGVAHVIPGSNGAGIWATDTEFATGSGWGYSIPMLTAVLGVDQFQNPGPPPTNATCTYISSYEFRDPSGTMHTLPISIAQSYTGGAGNCNLVQNGYPENILSGSDDFFQAVTTGVCSSCIPYAPNPVTVAGPDGTVYQFCTFGENDYYNTVSFWGPACSIEDRNGNLMGASGAQDQTYGVMIAMGVSDTVGRTVVSATARSGNANTITVSGVTGNYSQTWESVPVNFSVTSTGIGNYPCGSNSIVSDQTSNYVIKTLTLPNSESYQFSYDPTYGLLNKIQYPTGGYVSYSWNLNSQSELIGIPAPPSGNSGTIQACQVVYDYPAIASRTVSFDGVHTAETQTFAYSTNWTSNSKPWKQTTVTTTDALRGNTYQTVYTYGPLTMTPIAPNVGSLAPSYIPMEQSVVKQDFSGAILESDYKQWNDVFLLACELKELNNNTGFITAKWYTYGSGGQVTDTKEYDYGLVTSTTACSGAPPSNPTREVSTSYQSFPSTAIFPSSPSIFNRPAAIKTYGAGSQLAETDYAYDGTGVTSVSSLTEHDETNYSSSNNNRGNATSITVKCLQSGCVNAVTTYTYDEAGQVTSKTDPCGNATCSDMSGTSHTTDYYYTDSYTVLSGGSNTAYPVTGTTDAYLTKLVDPLSHASTFSYDYHSGELTAATDPNGQTSSFIYNDTFSRPTQATFPDQGQVEHIYNDAAPAPTVTTCQNINGTVGATCSATAPATGWKTNLETMDGLGHPVQQELVSDPSGADFTVTGYDGLGRVYQKYNPTRCSTPIMNCGETTWGMTVYTYDSLGRTKTVGEPDGSAISTSYSGNVTTTIDEATNQRTTTTDALGRITAVAEAPNVTGLNFISHYQYDALNNLLCAVQLGTSGGTFTSCTTTVPTVWRPRTFTYDSLSRLVSASNPESGTMQYSYDANGNLSKKTALSPNQASTGAATVATNYTYDVLNRLAGKGYSDTYPSNPTTPSVSYAYDAGNISSCPTPIGLAGTGPDGPTNPIGRRTAMCFNNGSKSWGYD
jgi:YD repeat-containing protein